jgi:hypothetical protein
VVLIQLRVNRGDLALPECVVQSLVNLLGLNAESRGGIAIEDEGCLQSLVLLVAGHVAQARQGP